MAAVQAAFDALGALVVMSTTTPAPGRPVGTAFAGTAAALDENEILVRLPRRVRLTTLRLDAAGRFVTRSSTTALVMDARCRLTPP